MSQKIRNAAEFLILAAMWVLPFSKAGFEIFFGLTLFFWFLSKVLTHDSLCKNQFLFVIIGFFAMSSSISAFSSGYPEISFRGMIKLLKYIMLMLIVTDLFFKPESLKRLFLVGLSGFVAVVLASLIQNLLGRELITGHPVLHANNLIRLTGPYDSYGLLATHVIAFFPILIAGMISSDRRRVAGFALTLLASVYVLYHTQSRGSWIALFLALFIYSLLTRNKWLAIILIVSGLTIPLVLPKKILFHLDAFKREQSLVERNLLWRRAIAVIKARPWFGCGINTYLKNYSQYTQGEEWALIKENAVKNEYTHFGEKENWRVPGHPDQIQSHYAHNGYLQLAAETGLISLVLFFIIMGISFRSGYQAYQWTEGTAKLIVAGTISGLLALLLHAMVDTTLHNLQSAVLIWFFLGLLIALKQVKRA